MNYFPNDGDGLHLCSVCGDSYCQWPATVCWRCREQEMIDAEDWLDEVDEASIDAMENDPEWAYEDSSMRDMYPLELDDDFEDDED